MKALVFGGKGFIGRSLCKRLQSIGWATLAPETEICNYADVRAFKGCGADAIFNLACPTKPVDYLANPMRTVLACSVGVNNLLELAEHLRCTLVHASTVRVLTETDHTGQHSCYVEGKRFAESLILAHQREYLHMKGITNMGNSCIARMYSTYGAEMLPSDTRVIPTFIRAAKINALIRLYGDGSQKDSFCDIDGVISDLIDLAVNPKLDPVSVGVPVTVTIKQLAELIVSLVDSKSKIECIGGAVPPDRGGANGPIHELTEGLNKMLGGGWK